MTYLALGSNLGDRLANLQRARDLLSPFSTKTIVSAPIYETDPLDCPSGSPPFLNTVLALETSLSPTELLQKTQTIESELGRESLSTRTLNSPRPIDIDLILVGDTVLATAELTLPHPRFHERLFVLHPLRDLAPALIPPTHANPVSILLEIVKTNELPPQIFQENW